MLRGLGVVQEWKASDYGGPEDGRGSRQTSIKQPGRLYWETGEERNEVGTGPRFDEPLVWLAQVDVCPSCSRHGVGSVAGSEFPDDR